MHPPIVGLDQPSPARLPGRPRRRSLKWALWGLLVLAGAIALFGALRRHAARERAAAPPRVVVATATASQGDIGVYLDEIGTVTALHTASITSQVTGQVLEVHYAEGQRVERGAALVDIDPRPFRAMLRQAEGALERDQNLLAEAKMDLERYRAAWARNAIARQTLEDQEKIVLQDEGTVENDQGNVEYQRVQVGFCHITAPFAGRVGLRLVDPGNVVQATGNTVLAVLAQIEPITVVFTISEDNLASVRARLARGAQLGVDAFDRAAQRKIASGTLLTLDNQIDTMTGTVKARALFDNSDDGLFPNQFVNVRLLVDTLRGVTLVPASAIQQNGPASYAYVIDDGVAHMRKVRAGVTDAGQTEVDGIAPGEVVADSGFDRLHDEAPVEVSAAPPPSPDAGAAP